MTKGSQHYRDLEIEVQDFSQKWELNGTEHSFLKYISRCYKKNKDKDVIKAWWFAFGETKNGTKPQEAVGSKSDTFILELLNYCSVNRLESWQTKVLINYFNREFNEVSKLLQTGIQQFKGIEENTQ